MRTLIPDFGTVSLRKEMDRLLDRIWDGNESHNLGEWNPRMDLSETPQMLICKIEVPGIDPADIHVTLQDGVLTVRGEKKKETEDKDENYLRLERSYGTFVRSMKLPAPVENTQAKATFNKGVLTIEMLKAAEAKGLSIPIKVV